MLNILAAACLLGCQNSGKELYESFEKRLADAKSLALRFKGTTGGAWKHEYSGKIRMKTGKKFLFELKTVIQGEAEELSVKSDGKRTVEIRKGERSEGVPWTETDDLLRRAAGTWNSSSGWNIPSMKIRRSTISSSSPASPSGAKRR